MPAAAAGSGGAAAASKMRKGVVACCGIAKHRGWARGGAYSRVLPRAPGGLLCLQFFFFLQVKRRTDKKKKKWCGWCWATRCGGWLRGATDAICSLLTDNAGGGGREGEGEGAGVEKHAHVHTTCASVPDRARGRDFLLLFASPACSA